MKILDLLKLDVTSKGMGVWLSNKWGEGEYKEWHVCGQLFEHSFWKDGFREGEFKRWWGNGQIEIDCYAKNRSFDGEYKVWDHKGKLVNHKLFKKGKWVKNYLNENS